MTKRPSATATLAAPDVREELLHRVRSDRVTASIVVAEAGVIAGVPYAQREVERLGLSVPSMVTSGTRVEAGADIARFIGAPRQIVLAEEVLIGALAKPSGIATAARRFVSRAAGRVRVVAGAWKKMPAAMKEMVREAVAAGGADPRIVAGPFVYLDKTWVELLGGIRESLAAVAHLEGHARVVQIKGRYDDVAREAHEAVAHGADIVFIDTGRIADVSAVKECLIGLGLRDGVRLAFGGGVALEDVDALSALGVDILDVGRPIVDAPLLDMRFEVVVAGDDR